MGIFSKSIKAHYDELELAQRQDEMPAALMPTSRSTTSVTSDTALGVGAVYRAASILATATSQLPMYAYRNELVVDPQPAYVKRPDVLTPYRDFIQGTVMSLALHGNAFWYVVRGSGEAPQNIQLLNARDVSVSQDVETGKMVYSYRGHTLPSFNIQHLRLLYIPGYPMGLGPIQSAAAELGGAVDLRDYASEWFNKAGVPTGVLSTDQMLSPDQAEDYRIRWHQIQSDRQVAVLGQGLDYKPILLDPKSAQFIESQQFSITQIARLFGIPATYMLAAVDGSSMTYSNVEQVDIQFLRYTLIQYLSAIESAMSELTPRGMNVRFKVDALLRADITTRVNAYKTMVEMGVMTVDEVRRSEGLGPLPQNTQVSDGSPI